MSSTSIDGALSQVFDQNPTRGNVYPLPAALTLPATAMLRGCRSLAAIAPWGRDYYHHPPNSASAAEPRIDRLTHAPHQRTPLHHGRTDG